MREKKRGPKAATGGDERVTVAVVLSRETLEMLSNMALDAGISRSQLVRYMIKKEYEHYEAIA